MLRVYQYRIYPTKHQETILKDTLEYCRYIYNETLSLRKREWEENKKLVSYFDTSRRLTEWKKQKPILHSVYAQVLQQVQVRVDLAFKAFFRRVRRGDKAGYPRFKSFGRYDSITYPQQGFKLSDKIVWIAKIGDIKIKRHRELQGKIKRVNIKRHQLNKWFICFVCEMDDIIKQPIINQKSIGIDVGLNHFLIQSDNQKKDNPRFYRKEEKALAKANRKFSKTKKGSFERFKKIKVLKRVYERISNKRKDFCHKASNSLVKKYGIICIEDLNIVNMFSKKAGLNKSINDVAWNMFFNCLEYKAEEADIQLIKVNPMNTSKSCSRCGIIKDRLGLEDRIYYCLWCGLEVDRDQNAAVNILRLGLQSLGKTIEA